MEEGRDPWFPQHFNWQLHGGSNQVIPQTLDDGRKIASVVKPDIETIMKNGSMNSNPLTWLPVSQAGFFNEPTKWVYCLPHGQSCRPTQNHYLSQCCPTVTGAASRVTNSPNETISAPKKFLVFDQSGDQTTLIFSCGIDQPVEGTCHARQMGAVSFNNLVPDTQLDTNLFLKSNMSEEFDIQSEMHEDTDELNALLYSDDDSEYDDDEVNSTGRSPNLFDGLIEVASSDGSSKKRKLFADSCEDVPLICKTLGSKMVSKNLESSMWEDDAESKCVGVGGVTSSNKRMKKERIRRTVSILQNIIPGVTCDDPILVLDEAIEYLKCLKTKAQALGPTLLTK